MGGLATQSGGCCERRPHGIDGFHDSDGRVQTRYHRCIVRKVSATAEGAKRWRAGKRLACGRFRGAGVLILVDFLDASREVYAGG